MQIETKERISDLINKNKIILFMKGSKIMPMCGFSNTVVQILNMLEVNYTTFDVLSDMEIREAIKIYSSWPTIPQLYIDNEFIGGADIVLNLYQTGELQEIIEKSLAS